MVGKITGFGIVDIIQIVFLVCKFTDIQPIANWSWWLVFSPLLIAVIFWFIFWTSAVLFVHFYYK
jgi:small Trp-rich protein